MMVKKTRKREEETHGRARGSPPPGECMFPVSRRESRIPFWLALESAERISERRAVLSASGIGRAALVSGSRLATFSIWNSLLPNFRSSFVPTVRHRGMGTGISEASKRVPIFSFDPQGGKQVSSHFRQGN